MSQSFCRMKPLQVFPSEKFQVRYSCFLPSWTQAVHQSHLSGCCFRKGHCFADDRFWQLEHLLWNWYPVIQINSFLRRQKILCQMYKCKSNPGLLSNGSAALPKQKDVVAPPWEWVVWSLPWDKRNPGPECFSLAEAGHLGVFLLFDYCAIWEAGGGGSVIIVA